MEFLNNINVKGKQLATEEFVDNQISSSAKQIEENVASIIPNLVDQALVNTDIVIDSDYVHTDNNYTTEEKNKLNNITDAGSSTNPVYFSNGKPVATTYTLGRSVPSNAVFTDTMVTSRTDTSDSDYRLLLSWLASDNEDTNVAGKNSKFTANPSTGVLSAPIFNGNISWNNVTDKPSTYTPESHTHSLNDVSELVDKLVSISGTAGSANSRAQYCVEQINDHIKPTLETKADSGHTHAISDVTNLSDMFTSINNTFNSKVDKVEGKGLSTNDYTTAEKTKLSGIANGANKTVVDSDLSTTSTNPVQNKVIASKIKATDSAVSSMSTSLNAAFNRLDNIENNYLPLSGDTVTGTTTFSQAELAGQLKINRASTASGVLSVIDYLVNNSRVGVLGFSDVSALRVKNASNADMLTVDSSGNGTFIGSVTAAKINGYTLADACAKGIINNTSISPIGWVSNTESATVVPTINTIAHWNGAAKADSTASNLAYCNKGAFGTAATKNVDTKATSGSSNLITSGAMYTALADKAPSSHGTHVTFSTTKPAANGTAAVGSATTVSRSDHVHPLQTSVSGNAGTATKLATARTINGVSFDGSANIAIPRSTKHIHVAAGKEGSVGYVKIATIKVTGEFANHPVEFVISQRSRGPYHLYVQFNSVSSKDPTLYEFKHFDPANKGVKAYIVKSATSTWDIYIEKVEAYDHIYILDVLKADGNEGVQYSITYTNVQASSVPTTNQTKSTAVSFGGTASSAIKLTTSAGSANQPVYFKDGKPVACGFKINNQSLLYSMSEVVSSPLTVNITGLFTAYTAVVCNVIISGGKHSLTLPLKYIKSLGTSASYEAEGILFYYVDDNKIRISTGRGQSNPTINDVKIISL